MGMRQNWALFIETAETKAKSHEKYAQYWDGVHSNISLILIVLSAVTTVLASLHVEKLVIVAISGITTLLSAVMGFLQPSKRKQTQSEAAKEFRSLMLRMVRCETDKDYEELWNLLNKEIIGEPFLPTKYKIKVQAEYSMTPELIILIDQKEDEVAAALADSGDEDLTEDENAKLIP